MSKFVSRPSDRDDFQALTQSLLRRDSIEGPSHEARQSGLLPPGDEGYSVYSSRPPSRADGGPSRPASFHRRNSEDGFVSRPASVGPSSRGTGTAAEDAALLSSQPERDGYGTLEDKGESYKTTTPPATSAVAGGSAPIATAFDGSINTNSTSTSTNNSYHHSHSYSDHSANNITAKTQHKGVTFEPGLKSEGPVGGDRNNRQRKHPMRRENSFFPDDIAPQPAAHHPKAGGMISPAEYAPRKLGTWDGVFMPVSLNVGTLHSGLYAVPTVPSAVRPAAPFLCGAVLCCADPPCLV